MSKPRFIRIPREVKDNSYNIDYFQEVYPYPNNMETIYLDYDYWLKFHNLKHTDLNKEKFKDEMNANSVKKYIIDPIILKKYHARQTHESGGGIGGYNMNLYIDQDNFDYVYFYTMNRYKSKKARRDFGDEKFFLINIYRIPYRLLKMLMNQNKYEFLFWQKPTGFVYNIDLASNKRHDWMKVTWKNRTNINW